MSSSASSEPILPRPTIGRALFASKNKKNNDVQAYYINEAERQTLDRSIEKEAKLYKKALESQIEAALKIDNSALVIPPQNLIELYKEGLREFKGVKKNEKILGQIEIAKSAIEKAQSDDKALVAEYAQLERKKHTPVGDRKKDETEKSILIKQAEVLLKIKDLSLFGPIEKIIGIYERLINHEILRDSPKLLEQLKNARERLIEVQEKHLKNKEIDKKLIKEYEKNKEELSLMPNDKKQLEKQLSVVSKIKNWSELKGSYGEMIEAKSILGLYETFNVNGYSLRKLDTQTQLAKKKFYDINKFDRSSPDEKAQERFDFYHAEYLKDPLDEHVKQNLAESAFRLSKDDLSKVPMSLNYIESALDLLDKPGGAKDEGEESSIKTSKTKYLLQMGSLYLRLGDKAKALECVKEARKIAPTNPNGQLNDISANEMISSSGELHELRDLVGLIDNKFTELNNLLLARKEAKEDTEIEKGILEWVKEIKELSQITGVPLDSMFKSERMHGLDQELVVNLRDFLFQQQSDFGKLGEIKKEEKGYALVKEETKSLRIEKRRIRLGKQEKVQPDLDVGTLSTIAQTLFTEQAITSVLSELDKILSLPTKGATLQTTSLGTKHGEISHPEESKSKVKGESTHPLEWIGESVQSKLDKKDEQQSNSDTYQASADKEPPILHVPLRRKSGS